MHVMWGAAGMLLLILTVKFGIPSAFAARVQYVDDVACGKRERIRLIPKKAPVQ